MKTQFFSPTILLLCCKSVLAIVGGLNATVNGKEAVVFIYPRGSFASERRLLVCQGALISRRHVVTLKTCCHEEFEYTIRIGSTITYGDDAEHYTVLGFRAGPSADAYTPCVMQLSRAVNYGNNVYPLVLATPQDFQDLSNLNLIAFGYGGLENGVEGIANQLQSLQLPVVNYQKCYSLYGKLRDFNKPTDEGRFLCVGYDSKLIRININDVGGPIIRDGDFKLYALASYDTATKEGGATLDPKVNPFPSVALSMGNKAVRQNIFNWMAELK